MSYAFFSETHVVPILEQPIRLSDYVAGIFELIPSKKGMKKAIKNGEVLVDGFVSSTGKFIHGGEKIELKLPKADESIPVFELSLDLVYEDESLAVVNKPSGILVSGNKFRTLENALPFNIKPSTLNDPLPRPLAVHRLDYPTTGLLLIAKTRSALRKLKQLFEEKKVQKTYYAAAIGDMPIQGQITLPIDGKQSLSVYEVEERLVSEKYGFINLVRLHPQTGRRHQLRKHLAEIGHPILGDKEYAPKGLFHAKGIYLHASALRFEHPLSGEDVLVKRGFPRKFRKLFGEKF